MEVAAVVVDLVRLKDETKDEIRGKEEDPCLLSEIIQDVYERRQ